jgi:hypothetical protein
MTKNERHKINDKRKDGHKIYDEKNVFVIEREIPHMIGDKTIFVMRTS